MMPGPFFVFPDGVRDNSLNPNRKLHRFHNSVPRETGRFPDFWRFPGKQTGWNQKFFSTETAVIAT